MIDRTRQAIPTRHRPARNTTVDLVGDVRLLAAQLAAVQADGTVTAVRAAADVPAAQDVIVGVIDSVSVI